MEDGSGNSWRAHLYSQVPLRAKNGDIRLLTIQPRSSLRLTSSATGDEPQPSIECFLRLANLQKTQLSFMAISHECEHGGRRRLLINGAQVPASQSLVELLEGLRQETDPVTVWIDILCVNGDDMEEKSAQIAQIAAIFSAAAETIVWLGPAADGSDDAMRVLDQLVEERLTPAAQKFFLEAVRKTQLAVRPSKTEQEGIDVPTNGATSDKPKSLDEQLQSLQTSFQPLMNRAYWSRLWSLQDLAFTSKGVVMCGNQKLGLDRFYLSARALDGVLNMATYSKWLASGEAPAPSTTFEVTEPANFLKSPAMRLLAEREFYISGRGWWSARDHPLLAVLSRYYLAKTENRMQLDVSDERDVIFGLIGLATDIDELGLSIDYSKDFAQISLETTLALLRQNPKVLQLCQGIDELDDTRISWLVDWSRAEIPRSWNCGCSFNACGPADSRFYRLDSCSPGTIALKSVHLDSVAAVERNLSDDTVQGAKPAATVDRLFDQSLDISNSPYRADQKPDIPPVMIGNSFFITKTGYIGSGRNVKENDLIAILYGAELPFALRKQDESYRIIGEVYVHGIMEGEFMKSHRKESIVNII